MGLLLIFSDTFCMKNFHFQGKIAVLLHHIPQLILHGVLYSLIDMKYCLCIFRLEIKLKDFVQRTQEVLFSTWTAGFELEKHHSPLH